MPTTQNATTIESQVLTAKQLAELLQTSERSIWRGVAANIIPAPLYISPKAPRWPKSKINEWLDTQ